MSNNSTKSKKYQHDQLFEQWVEKLDNMTPEDWKKLKAEVLSSRRDRSLESGS